MNLSRKHIVSERVGNQADGTIHEKSLRGHRVTKKAWRASFALMGTLAMLATAEGVSSHSTHAYAGTVTQSAASTINSLLNQSATKGDFSGSVFIEKNGHVVVDKSYGYANVTSKTKITSQTGFAIGALTEGFTAVAILQLKEQGLLNLDDPVSKFSPNYPQQLGNEITIQELLTHTSGAPSTAKEAANVPGTGFRYSVLNYALLGQIIEKVSGASYTSYVQTHILLPLGLKDTGFIHSLDDVPHAATGYVMNQGYMMPLNIQEQKFASSDGLYSTSDDLAKWEDALLAHKLITASDTKLLFAANPVTVETLKTFGFGFGWEVSLDSNAALEESSVGGFHSYIMHNNSEQETIIVLSNREWAPVDDLVVKIEKTLNG